MERKTVILLRKAVTEVAAPRTLLGNSSPNRMKGTGPRPQAYPKVIRMHEITGTRLGRGVLHVKKPCNKGKRRG